MQEHACLQKYYAEGKRRRQSVKLSGIRPSAIPRKIEKNRTYRYAVDIDNPHTAQGKSLLRRSSWYREMFWNKPSTE